jgi:predicted Zn-dependent protease
MTIFSSNVINGINYYLDKKNDTGLLAMIARDSGHLIQKHYTREMASHTHLPLLVLHDA